MIDTEDIDVFLGLDAGKGEHHATAVTPADKKAFGKRLPDAEPKLRELFAEQKAEHGRVLVVVHQLAWIGALPLAVARDVGGEVAHLPGLTARRTAGFCPGRPERPRRTPGSPARRPSPARPDDYRSRTGRMLSPADSRTGTSSLMTVTLPRPFADMGALAVSHLMRRNAAPEPESVEPRLVVRSLIARVKQKDRKRDPAVRGGPRGLARGRGKVGQSVPPCRCYVRWTEPCGDLRIRAGGPLLSRTTSSGRRS
ncbi:transposase [Streptomyces sp. NPDC087307]|uniref:IS110 family transposase n=1 Tax=Streptomyces sp. NPDC087307 TaxID=3365782 RepID=UPI00380188DD